MAQSSTCHLVSSVLINQLSGCGRSAVLPDQTMVYMNKISLFSRTSSSSSAVPVDLVLRGFCSVSQSWREVMMNSAETVGGSTWLPPDDFIIWTVWDKVKDVLKTVKGPVSLIGPGSDPSVKSLQRALNELRSNSEQISWAEMACCVPRPQGCRRVSLTMSKENKPAETSEGLLFNPGFNRLNPES